MNSNRPPNAPATGRKRSRVARGGILILGGGFAGTELARSVGKATVVNSAPPRAAVPDVELVLGSAVSVDPDRRAAEIDADVGRLSIAYAELVIALGSIRGPSPVAGLPLDERGRIRVDERLRVPGASHIWALGDCAAVPHADGLGRTDSPTCQDAVRQARQLARELRGAPRPDWSKP